MSKFTIVPTVRTLSSPEEMLPLISKCYAEIEDEAPDAASLCMILSQTALESGAFKKMLNGNIGNIRPGSKWRGLVCQFKCNERILKNGKYVVEWYTPPDPRTNFRAFATLEDGVRDYCRFLGVDTTPNNNRPNRYADAWQAIVDADADDTEHDVYVFTQELHRAGYYTAPPDLYYDGRNGKGGVLALFRQYMPYAEAFVEANRDTIPPDTIETGDVDALNARIAELEKQNAAVRGEVADLQNWRVAMSEAAAS